MRSQGQANPPDVAPAPTPSTVAPAPAGTRPTPSTRRSADPKPLPVILLRYLDLVLLALALPVFLAAGWPVEGWAAAALAWGLQRGIQSFANRKAMAQADRRKTVGIITGSMIGRGWLVALIIFGAGLTFGDDAGLSAAVLVIVLFTAYFTVSMIMRPFQSGSEQPS